ncbi:MAG: hypothetical protein HOO67_03250 [Candidatus Peribacteraceae bacterium]|nr:hypothetical protein [Candidatus Peribacteraceae bacterium]
MNGEVNSVKDYECLLDEVSLLRDANLIDDDAQERMSNEIRMHCMGRDRYLYNDLLTLLGSRTEKDRVRCDPDSPVHQRLLLEAYVDLNLSEIPMGLMNPHMFSQRMEVECLLRQPSNVFERMIDYQECIVQEDSH